MNQTMSGEDVDAVARPQSDLTAVLNGKRAAGYRLQQVHVPRPRSL